MIPVDESLLTSETWVEIKKPKKKGEICYTYIKIRQGKKGMGEEKSIRKKGEEEKTDEKSRKGINIRIRETKDRKKWGNKYREGRKRKQAR